MKVAGLLPISGRGSPNRHMIRYRVRPDGGYDYLHATKGWRRVSPARARLLRIAA